MVVGVFTVTVVVAVLAHCPALGVKVYVVVCVLSMAGDHVPGIPSIELAGNESGSPAQIAEIGANVVVVGVFTVTVIVAVLAHCPALGVKVYVVVCVLSMAGDQVPVMLLLEVVGKVNDPPEQMAGTCVNVGVLDVAVEFVIVKENDPGMSKSTFVNNLI